MAGTGAGAVRDTSRCLADGPETSSCRTSVGMSIRITLAGAQITELVSAMEAQRDYYAEELHRIVADNQLRSPAAQAVAESRRSDLIAWRDACDQVLAKVSRAQGGSRRAEVARSVPLGELLSQGSRESGLDVAQEA